MNNSGNWITQDTDGELHCACGNDSSSEGFYPCDTQGKQVEPTAKDRPVPLYVCGACGAIIEL